MMTTHRPRNVNTARAAGMLYGDWGTSKAYVIGLAFALAGYASFWPILGVCILSLFVGINYMVICKYYPNGGGVYASVRRRSKALAVVGAFFLVADYLVTAALSALAAFSYLGVSDPILYSALFIVLIGLFNYFGPKHSGGFSFIVAVGAVLVFTVLALFCLPFLREGVHNLAPMPHDPKTFWVQFCSVIVALSGIETIANSTAVMKLNRGSTLKKPLVTHTANPAILYVMLEVVVYTALFALAATAIPYFLIENQTVSAPGFPNVGDHMLSYMAQVFGSKLISPVFGIVFEKIVEIVVGIILLSAVNTAINGLVSLQYLMASDEELPQSFRKVNFFGVPIVPLIVATLIPAILILVFKKIALLAGLYAIGFVGAIATNLGATSTDKNLGLSKITRIFMFGTFLVMALIEITLFIEKPEARYFALGILALGMLLREVTKRIKIKPPPLLAAETRGEEKKGGLLCVVKRFRKATQKAVEKSKKRGVPLYIVFIREQKVISEKDLKRTGGNDRLAKKVFEYVQKHGDPTLCHFYYCVTDSFVNMALAYAARLEVSEIMIDTPPSKLLALLRGNYAKNLQKALDNAYQLTII